MSGAAPSVRIETERLVTCDPARATPADPLGVVELGVVILEGATISYAGPASDAPRATSASTRLAAPLVTPGLVDAHTHAAFMGSRHDEYALRMAGAGYEEIARAGGGIVSSMRAVRAASEGEIADALRARLRRMATLGVTTVEVKSGYGLDRANEAKQLLAAERVRGAIDLPEVVPTYLCLHALPPDATDRARYAAHVAKNDVPAIAELGIAAFVDAYVDRNAFSVAEARPALARAKDLGLGVRLHVGQFADVGGAELAADLEAASADHLEQVSPAGAERMARAGVRAVLLPVASFTLGQAPPPVALFRSCGVPLVVATDANPGTAPTESLPLALALAVRSYGLTIAEAVLGVTREAALSLALTDRGVLRAGARADVTLWDLPHEATLAQPFGTARTCGVFSRGVRIA